MSKKINVAAIMRQVDEYYAKNRGFDAEKLMQDSILEAASIGDEGSLLQLLNELLGYYRETSRVKDSYAIAKQCMDLAVRMGLEGTIPYATTLLNVANAYRAGGRLKDSLQLYLKVREIYDVQLSKDDMLIASMENNLSLLYQELGEFAEAKASLLRALRIVETKTGVEFELAVTYANLATSCLNIREMEEAYSYAKASIQAFDAITEEQIEDIAIGDLDTSFAIKSLGNEQLFWTILKEYYRVIEKKVNLIKSLEEQEDWPAYTIEVHALKSASKQIGAMSLSDKAAAMEKAGNAKDGETIHKCTDEMLEQYLGYLSILHPFCQEEEETDSQKEAASDEVLHKYFEDMQAAIEDLDMDQMEEVIQKMSEFSYEDWQQELFLQLKDAVAEIDVDACEAVIHDWESKLETL